jgi:glycosyltransferase involved in cell wall biosynthesis
VRYATIKHDRICSVSNVPFECNGGEFGTIQVPDELSHISSKDLILSGKVKNGKIAGKFVKKPASHMKIALIGNYGSKCGIGTYCKFLYDELINYVGDYKLFVEKQDNYEIENPKIPQDKIVACWKRGENLSELIKNVENYNPDIILIQHEFGIWPNARIWLSLMSQLSDYRIITTMHSVFPDHNDKIIYEAAMPEIVVHLPQAKENLINEKKINGKVYVIPHGCYAIGNQKKLWNTYHSDFTFIQQGFGFEYKNFEGSIKAAALLKPKYPDIFFTGLFSESPHNVVGHTIYFNKLMDLIKRCNIRESVSIIRGFQSENVINSYLRTNQVGIFPYVSVPGHEVFGASGAARLAMSAGIPIITSSIPHFSDLPSIKADSPEKIAEELDKLFSDKQLQVQQIAKQNQFIIDNSWDNIAKKYVAVFENEINDKK